MFVDVYGSNRSLSILRDFAANWQIRNYLCSKLQGKPNVEIRPNTEGGVFDNLKNDICHVHQFGKR
jgi:hypothetical protein